LPLAKGKGRETISKNIAEMRRSGYPADRAAAAAYRTARQSGAKLPKKGT
jgi:hypothetical protein